MDQSQAFDQHEYAQLPDDEAQASALHISTPAPTNDEPEIATTGGRAGGNIFEQVKRFRQQLGQYTNFFLTPLLFFLLFSIIVLPLVAIRQTNPVWPFLFIFIVLAIVQGFTIYNLGSANGLWPAVTVLSFCIFVVVSVFALAGLLPSLLALLVAAGLCAVLAHYYVYPVHEGFVSIVYAFGKYRRTLYPGLNILLPIEKVEPPLNVGETQWICPVQRVQLSRNEDVMLRAAISYQVIPEDAHVAVVQVNQWQESLRELLLVSLQTIATTFMPEDFIAWPQGLAVQVQQPSSTDGAHWDRVNAYLFQHLRDRAALWGVQVNWVRIRDVSLMPHGSVTMEPEAEERIVRVSANPGAKASAQKASNGSAVASKPDEPTQPEVPAAIKLPKEEALIKAYKEVQRGNITDPETIRSIAQQFAIIAGNPEKSTQVSFDAERAAANLFEQSRKYQEQYGPGPTYDSHTKPEK
jgi:regulator of protease activity HflC (stomatin/prohibitin superfamily)